MGEITWRIRRSGEHTLVEIEDLRYGLPGEAPDLGLWGIRGHYTESGQRVGVAERYSRRVTGRVGPVLRSMWRGTWGNFSLLGSGGLISAATTAARS